MGSERLPGKVMMEIRGVPLIERIAWKLSFAGKVVIATTEKKEDDPVWEWANGHGYPCYRGEENDVLKRIVGAMNAFLPGYEFVMRGLGDCPFPEHRFIRRAAEVMSKTGTDVFFWLLPSWVWPVYGAREFPLRRSLWERMDKEAIGDEREHPDLWIHRHREELRRIYHQPPSPAYFRPHRLEVDYEEDIELLRAILKKTGGHWPDLLDVLRILDENPEIAMINAERGERTGPYASYSQEDRHKWARAQVGQRVVLWNDEIMEPGKRSKPIFCHAGLCLVGFHEGEELVTVYGDRIKKGFVHCPCGAGRFWREAIPGASPERHART